MMTNNSQQRRRNAARPVNTGNYWSLSPDDQQIKEEIWEQALSHEYEDGFKHSDFDYYEDDVTVRRIIEEIADDGYLTKVGDYWHLNLPLRPNRPYRVVDPERVYYATPLSQLSQKTLDESRSGPIEGWSHLWTKFAASVASPLIGANRELWDSWRIPDVAFFYHGANQDLLGEAWLIFCSYSTSNPVSEQVLDYLRRGFGVRILILDGEEGVRSSVQSSLSSMTPDQFVYGRADPPHGRFTVGELLTLKNVSYEIRVNSRIPADAGTDVVNWLDEMDPSALNGHNWETTSDHHPTGWYHTGTFQIPGYSEFVRGSSDEYARRYADHPVEVYVSATATEFAVEFANVHAQYPHWFSREEMHAYVGREGAVRIGPSRGISTF